MEHILDIIFAEASKKRRNNGYNFIDIDITNAANYCATLCRDAQTDSVGVHASYLAGVDRLVKKYRTPDVHRLRVLLHDKNAKMDALIKKITHPDILHMICRVSQRTVRFLLTLRSVCKQWNRIASSYIQQLYFSDLYHSELYKFDSKYTEKTRRFFNEFAHRVPSSFPNVRAIVADFHCWMELQLQSAYLHAFAVSNPKITWFIVQPHNSENYGVPISKNYIDVRGANLVLRNNPFIYSAVFLNANSVSSVSSTPNIGPVRDLLVCDIRCLNSLLITHHQTPRLYLFSREYFLQCEEFFCPEYLEDLVQWKIIYLDPNCQTLASALHKLVAFAKRRNIVVVSSFDVPGFEGQISLQAPDTYTHIKTLYPLRKIVYSP